MLMLLSVKTVRGPAFIDFWIHIIINTHDISLGTIWTPTLATAMIHVHVHLWGSSVKRWYDLSTEISYDISYAKSTWVISRDRSRSVIWYRDDRDVICLITIIGLFYHIPYLDVGSRTAKGHGWWHASTIGSRYSKNVTSPSVTADM